MEKAIISDTSCLILLQKLDVLEILQQLFSTIIITPEIQKEFGQPLPDWIHVESPQNSYQFSVIKLLVDEGEASAISLSLEKPDSLLIIDEQKGRKLAKDLGLQIVGTLGVLLEAKLQGKISNISSFIASIEDTNFRLSPKLINEVLSQAGER